MEYTQIDPQTRLTAVQARIRDIETQYMQLELRVQAPDMNQPPGGNMDAQNLQRLDDSLKTLHSMEAELQQQINSGQPGAQTPPAA